MSISSILGWLHGLAFLLTLSGLSAQVWKLIGKHMSRKMVNTVEQSVLIVNVLIAQYAAFASYMLYGLVFDGIKWELTGTRAMACALVWISMWFTAIDTANFTVAIKKCGLTLVLTFLAIGGVRLFQGSHPFSTRCVIQILIVSANARLFISFSQQARRIVKERSIGNLSATAHYLLFVKDVTACLYGLSLGLGEGWPLLLANGTLLISRWPILRAVRAVKEECQVKIRRTEASEI